VRSSAITFEKANHVASVTLSRPDDGNAIDPQMAREIAEACEDIRADENIRVVLLTGAGQGAFSVGAGSPGAGRPGPLGAAAALDAVEQPVIAAINGDALGDGLELALSCDIRLASDGARFGLTQVAGGRIPSEGGTQRLPRIVGRARALEMVFTAGIIDAAEALEIGLVSKVVPRDALAAEARSLAESLAGKAPIALRYAKEAVRKGLDLTLDQGLRLEADLYFMLHTTSDRTEGIRAFLDKRPPRFEGK
jgi:enoyl-CoA hydratase/carnithine racemase